MPTGKNKAGPDLERLDRTVAEARRAPDERPQSYRGQALKLFPWICGRCAREFDHTNVRELTVHHKDHNHDNNPPDASDPHALRRPRLAAQEGRLGRNVVLEYSQRCKSRTTTLARHSPPASWSGWSSW
jgi:hypothetical protein